MGRHHGVWHLRLRRPMFFLQVPFFRGGIIVVRNLSLDVTVNCSPEIAISRYFKKVALKSLVLIVCICLSRNGVVQVSCTTIEMQSITRQCCGTACAVTLFAKRRKQAPVLLRP